MKSFLKLFISFVLLISPATSYAGAWLTNPGESVLINSFYYYHFNEFTDTEGNTTDRPDFVKIEYKPYFEYGINDRFSAGFSPSFQHVTGEYLNSTGSGKDVNYGFISSDIFLKTKIYENTDRGIVFSLTPLIEVPGVYQEQTTPFFGKQETFWNLIAAFGKSLYHIGRNYGYLNFETDLRSRVTDSFTDQGGGSVKLDLTAGLPVTKTDSAILNVNYIKTISAYSPTNSFLDRYGYDAMQYSFGGKRQFKDFALEYSVIVQDYARNTGVGQGFKISIWHSF